MSVLNGKQVTIPEAVLHQQLDTETVLLHLETETYYGLNEVGSRIWECLEEDGALDPLVAALTDEYEIDETTLRGDIERWLDDLARAGLIEIEPGPDV